MSTSSTVGRFTTKQQIPLEWKLTYEKEYVRVIKYTIVFHVNLICQFIYTCHLATINISLNPISRIRQDNTITFHVKNAWISANLHLPDTGQKSNTSRQL